MNEEPDFVRNKIRASKGGKTPARVTRARASQAHISTEKEQKLHDLLAPHLPAAAQAWVDGLEATKTAWNQQSHQFEDTGLPDHKIRAECAEKIWHNVVGRPIERSMEVTGSYKELSTVLEELRQTPEASWLLSPELFETLQSAAEGKEIAPAHNSERKPDSEQKTE